MTKTKRKLVVMITSTVAAALLLAILYVWLAVPFSWYRCPKEPVYTCKGSIPTPDSVKYIKGFTHSLDAEDEERLIALFAELVAAAKGEVHYKCNDTPRQIRKMVRERGALEFRYSTRVSCEQPFKTPVKANDIYVFDLIWLLLSENGKVTIIFLRGGIPILMRRTLVGFHTSCWIST